MKNKEKSIRKLIICIGILFASYCVFLFPGMTSDYIPLWGRTDMCPLPSFSVQTLITGDFSAFIIRICYYFFERMGVSFFSNKYIFQIIGIIFLGISAWIIEGLLEQNSNTVSKSFYLFPVLLCFVNPYVIETFVYEAFSPSLGILLAVLAVYFVNGKKYTLGAVFAYLSVGIYMTNFIIILMICGSVTYIRFYREKAFVIIKKVLLMCTPEIIGGGMKLAQYFLGVKLLGESYSSKGYGILPGEGRIVAIIRAYIDSLKSLYCTGFGYIPKWIPFVFVVIITSVVLGTLICTRRQISSIVIWLAFCMIILPLPVLIQVITSYGAYARMLVPFFYCLSMLLCVAKTIVYYECPQIVKYINVFSIIFLLVIFVKTQEYITDYYIGQALDMEKAQMIQKEIEEYEEENEIKVQEIVSCRSRNFEWKHSQQLVRSSYDYNHKIYGDDWAQGQYINYVNGKNYGFRNMTEEEKDKYYDKNEELIFEGTTLYWIVH